MAVTPSTWLETSVSLSGQLWRVPNVSKNYDDASLIYDSSEFYDTYDPATQSVEDIQSQRWRDGGQLGQATDFNDPDVLFADASTYYNDFNGGLVTPDNLPFTSWSDVT